MLYQITSYYFYLICFRGARVWRCILKKHIVSIICVYIYMYNVYLYIYTWIFRSSYWNDLISGFRLYTVYMWICSCWTNSCGVPLIIPTHPKTWRKGLDWYQPSSINTKTNSTLPETNSSHLKIGLANKKVVFQPPFSGAMLVSEG